MINKERNELKKASFSAVISTAIVCFIFWLLITGQLVMLLEGEPSWQVLVAGVLVSVGVALFSAKFFIHSNPFYIWHPKRLGAALLYCIIIFPWELIKANWDMAKRALSPKLNINPGIVKIPVEMKSDFGLMALANSITLTPGTITMEVAEQDGQNYFYVHWIDASADGEEGTKEICGTMQKWLRRIWK